jgi:hypothetical protein
MSDITYEQEQELKRVAFIQGLRDLANLLDLFPDLPVPYSPMAIDVWADDKEELAVLVRGKGTWDKIAESSYMVFRKDFGHVRYDINIAREKVCEKVVVGVEIIPARPATKEQIVDKYEWKCLPLLNDDPQPQCKVCGMGHGQHLANCPRAIQQAGR